eukprot:GDKI01030162.1.p1 GENE.GDKI01030162.1~~GDKI01030162.1.p1  ORF type:complete len:150 (-),score=32.78 GDKI01030162.1:464-913(-)
MMKMWVTKGDIIKLHVGGRDFTTTRATLCTNPDSILAAIFSGRWEGNIHRDETGLPFLDFNPSLFEILLKHLRALQLSPDKKMPSPVSLSLSPEQKQIWKSMCEYLGFREVRTGYKFDAAKMWMTRFELLQDGRAGLGVCACRFCVCGG